MPQFAQCPECQRWVQAKDHVTGRLRCPNCAAETRADALVWQPLMSWIAEDASGAEGQLAATVGASEPAEAQPSGATTPVLSSLSLTGGSPSGSEPSPRNVAIQPTARSTTSSTLASRRTSGSRGRPLLEFAKIVAGGLAGVIIAQAILWWLPGNWRRDPFQLAPHIPPALQFLLPAELRPLQLPPSMEFVPPGTLEDWSTSEPVPSQRDPTTEAESSPLVETNPAPEVDAGNPTGSQAETVTPAVSAESSNAQTPAPADSSPSSEVPVEESSAPSSDAAPGASGTEGTPPDASPGDPGNPGNGEPGKAPDAPQSGINGRRVEPLNRVANSASSPITRFTHPLSVRPPKRAASRELELVSWNASSLADDALGSPSLAEPRVSTKDRLRAGWWALNERLDRYENLDRSENVVQTESAREAEAQQIYEGLCQLAETLARVKGDEYPEVGEQLNDVDALLDRLSQHGELVQRFRAKSLLWASDQMTRGVVLVGQVEAVRHDAGPPGVAIDLRFTDTTGARVTLWGRVSPELDARQPYRAGDWLLVLGTRPAEGRLDADPVPPVHVALHQILPDLGSL